MATVAIVGRKNVGKSTIFNRLTEMKRSIVYKEPGVTRDRIYGEILWRGRVFNLIDTGGFFPTEEANLTKKIIGQIEFALRECDLVYFVVSGKDGLTPQDEEICKKLRRLNKKIFLLVNKIDQKKDEIRVLEFSKLGIEPLFAVSAEKGFGFGEVLEETISYLPKFQAPNSDKKIKLLILGRPNAGKSTLLNSILRQERAIVDELPGTTRDLVNAVFMYKDKALEIIDTTGMRRRSHIKSAIEFYSVMRAMRMVERVDIVVLIFDTTIGVTRQDLSIASLILSKARCLIIVPNKLDLIANKDIFRVIPSTRMSFSFLDFVPIIPISAKTNLGIETLLDKILDIYEENKKIVDKKALKSLVGSLQPPPGGQVLKLTQIGSAPPVFKFTLTTKVREDYIKYVRNTIRNHFGFNGIPILIKTVGVRHNG